MKTGNRAYNQEELDLICNMNLTPAEVAEMLGITANAVRRKRQRLRNEDGLDLPRRMNGRPRIAATEGYENIIKDTTLSNEEVAVKVGCSTQTIRNRRLEMQGKNPYEHKKHTPKTKDFDYDFNINKEICKSWQDSPATLEKKISNLELLLKNLKNTKDMRIQNNEKGFATT